MKRTNRALEGFLWLIMVIPFIYMSGIWGSLPDSVATHFSIDGSPDDYSSKNSLLWIIGGLNLGLYLLMKFIPKIDPKKNFDKSGHYPKLKVIMQLFASALSIIILYGALQSKVSAVPTFVLLALFLTVFGNYMQSLKPNYFIGIRTPWTLEDEVTWIKTHRIGGRLWFFGGMVFIALIYFIPTAFFLQAFIAYTVGTALFVLVYSYIIYKQQKKLSNS